jgi:hypothetical protein
MDQGLGRLSLASPVALPRKHVWTKILAGDWVEFDLHLNSVGALTGVGMAGVASGGLSAAITAVPH